MDGDEHPSASSPNTTTTTPPSPLSTAPPPLEVSGSGGSSNDAFLENLSSLRRLLSVNYETLVTEPRSPTKKMALPLRAAPLPPQQFDVDNKEVQSLKNQLQDAKEQLNKERVEHLKLQASHSRLVTHNEDLNDRIHAQAKSIESFRQELETSRKRSKEDKDKAHNDLQKLKQALEQVAADRIQAVKNADEGQTRAMSLEQQIRDLQGQHESTRQASDAERHRQEKTISNLQVACANATNRAEEQRQTIAELQAKLGLLEREHARAEAAQSECEARAQRAEHELAKQRDDLITAQSQSSGWRRTLDQTDRVLRESNQEIVDLQQKLEDERRAHELTKQALQETSCKIELKRRHEHSHQEQKIQQLEQKVVELNLQLKDRVQMKLKDQKQHSELMAELHAKVEVIHAKDNEIQHLKQKHDVMAKMETSNKARIETLRKSLAGFKGRPDSSTQQLRDELMQAKTNLRATQSEISDALVQLSTISSSREGKEDAGNFTLCDLISQLVAENMQLKNESKSAVVGTVANTTTMPPSSSLSHLRQQSPRKFSQLAQEASRNKKIRNSKARSLGQLLS